MKSSHIKLGHAQIIFFAFFFTYSLPRRQLCTEKSLKKNKKTTNKQTNKQANKQKTNHDKTISIPYYTVVCHVVIIKHML